MMNKLLTIVRTQLAVTFAYRSTVFFWLCMHALSFFVIYAFWTAVFSEQSSISGFQFESMITYIILVNLIREFVLVAPEYEINDHIRLGSLSNSLVRPLSYPLHVLLSSSFWHIIETIFAILLYTFIGYLALGHTLWTIDLSLFLVLIPLLFLGHILCSLLSFSLGCLAFWLTEASAFFYYKEILILLTSGMFFPKATTPIWFQKIMEFLPFYHTMGIPGEILVGKAPVNVLSSSLINLSLWTLVLSLIAMIIWNRGVRKYEAVGN